MWIVGANIAAGAHPDPITLQISVHADFTPPTAPATGPQIGQLSPGSDRNLSNQCFHGEKLLGRDAYPCFTIFLKSHNNIKADSFSMSPYHSLLEHLYLLQRI